MGGSLSAVLPPLRDELALHPGPVAADGSPTWTLHDPARNKFFRIDWPAFEMLARWDAGSPEAVAEQVTAETTLHVEPDDVLDVVRFIAGNFLARPSGAADLDRISAASRAGRTSWATWLLHHYLFFRIPLVRPDRWLARLLPQMAWAFDARALWATVAALVLGLVLAGQQWDGFLHTLANTVSPQGMAWYVVALSFAKVFHELGHALTAKRLGCRVPTMGLAFLVMWPVLYTDVTEAWKLTSRRHRLAIGGAGVVVEMAIAAWALLAWSLLPEGPARSAAFVLATATLAATLVINLSPFMRFDGYFLVMDALDLPNLHPRSFALARWWLRERLFSLDEPPPEHLPPGRRAALVAFGFATWIYRLTLFLGIAVLVYHFFVKALGIVLFAVEIGWFVFLPVVQELREWWMRRDLIRAGGRMRPWGMFLAGLLLLLIVPWQSRVTAPALLRAGYLSTVFTPAGGQVARLDVAEGQRVAEGQVLAVLRSPDLDNRLAVARARERVLGYELQSVAFDADFRSKAQQLEQQLGAAVAERIGLEGEQAKLTLTATVAGRIADLDPTLKPGQWAAARARLMTVVGDGPPVAEALVEEHDLDRLTVGDTCTFHPDEPGWEVLDCRVETIDRIGSSVLSLPKLGNVNGGPIEVRQVERLPVADRAYYRVRLVVVAETPPAMELRGAAVVDGGRASILGGVLRSVAAVLLREMGI